MATFLAFEGDTIIEITPTPIYGVMNVYERFWFEISMK